MKERVSNPAFSSLEEPTLSDLVLAVVGSGERALATALLDVLEESARNARVLDATAVSIRRQDLARATGIASTNLSKVTGPLVRSGWLRTAADAGGLIYRRSVVVDGLVRGRTLAEWRKHATKRFGGSVL